MRINGKYNTTQIGLRGTAEMKKKIQECARKNNLSVNDFILRAIEHELAELNDEGTAFRFVYFENSKKRDIGKLDPETSQLSPSMIEEYNAIVDVYKEHPAKAKSRVIDDINYLGNFLS